jgi:hypothetical protein
VPHEKLPSKNDSFGPGTIACPILATVVEERDGARSGRRGQVHVTKGGRQVCVSGEFLDRLRRRALHGQMRAKGMTQDVSVSGCGEPGPPLRTFDPVSERVPGYGQSIVEREDAFAAQVTVVLERSEESLGHWNDAAATALRRAHDPFPVRLLDSDLLAGEVDIASTQRANLAPSEPCVAAQKDGSSAESVGVKGAEVARRSSRSSHRGIVWNVPPASSAPSAGRGEW